MVQINDSLDASHVRHFVSLSLWLTAFWACFGSLHAQETLPPAIRGVERINISTGGTGLYRPQKWGMVKLSLRNPQNREVNLLSSTHFLGDPTLQFGRRLWMPAHSRMTTWHPLLMPVITDPGQKTFELRTQVMTTEGGVETLAMNDVGAMQIDQSLRVSSNEPVTAMIGEPMLAESENSLWANSLDLSLTARYERGMTRNWTVLGEPLAPAGEELLDALDHLIIADDRILTDIAGIGAIRRWVTGGGHLWVMADRVSPEVLEALLGDEDALTIVDRVGLTHVQVVPAAGSPVTAPFERDLDRPAPLVRVIAENIEPAFLVDGWPAAFWKSYGDGRVLVTTLGANGWLRSRRSTDPLPQKPTESEFAMGSGSQASFTTRFFPGEPLNKLSEDFFARRRPSPFQATVAEQQVRQMIGYTIPSRGIVLGTLLGFTALIAVGGLWLGRVGRMEWLGVATPVTALLAAGVLLVIGVRGRAEIATSLSAVQLVQSIPGTADLRTLGVAGVFSKGDKTTASYAGSGGGWMMPEMSGLEGTTRRLIWTDIDQWSWEQLPQKPGLRTLLTQSSGRAAQPISAVAEFSSGRLAGHLTLPDDLQPTDVILATSSGRIGLQMAADGQWTTAADSELSADQYLSASVLSDEQQRRTEILSKMLASTVANPMPRVPTLYAWTKPWTSGASLGQDGEVNGSALVAVPMSWQRPEAGAEFTLPRPLLTFREVSGPDGIRPSGFFDVRSGQWVERTGSTGGWVAFDVPPAILPLKSKRVEVTCKVIGSMGRLEISGFRDGVVRSIHVWDNPVGTLKFTIEDCSLVPIDAAGRLTFRVDAGTANAALPTDLPIENGDRPRPPVRGIPGPGPSFTGPLPNSSSPPLDPTKDIESKVTPLTYWQFEEISARITVVVPPVDTASTTAP